MLVIFSGGSGVGKNTVISEFLKREGYSLMPTYTTRNRRDGETDGNPYYFLTKEQFEKKIAEGEFYEHEIVHGNYYGTSKVLLKNGQQSGDVLLKDIDVLGTINLTERVSDDVKIVTLFLQVDSAEVLRQRLIGRGETEIDKRLSRYEMEQGYKYKYDYIITNNDLHVTTASVDAIIDYESNSKFLLAENTRLDTDLVNAYKKALTYGESIPTVKVAVCNGDIYIVDGKELYVASLMLGKKVAKEIVNDYKVNPVCQTEWTNYLKSL